MVEPCRRQIEVLYHFVIRGLLRCWLGCPGAEAFSARTAGTVALHGVGCERSVAPGSTENPGCFADSSLHGICLWDCELQA